MADTAFAPVKQDSGMRADWSTERIQTNSDSDHSMQSCGTAMLYFSER